MRYFESTARVTTDRALIDLRDARDNLSIEINILEDSDRIDPADIGALRRKLGLLNQRIASHSKLIGA